MSRVSTYLNFAGRAEEALTFYKDLFGTEFVGPFVRYAEAFGEDGPPISDEERSMLMHAEVEIADGHVLMATDMLASLGHECRIGNNTTINVEADSREEVDRLYRALSEGSTEFNEPTLMSWGQYWSTCLDRFGIRWMIGSS